MKTTLRVSLALASLALAGFVGGCATHESCCDDAGGKKDGACCTEGAANGKACCNDAATTGDVNAGEAKQPATAK
jgi:hypothetical protein